MIYEFRLNGSRTERFKKRGAERSEGFSSNLSAYRVPARNLNDFAHLLTGHPC